ncbi:MAG: hypothetical protein J6K61_07125 [Clostridia bacterium]|nr:hypothetical protein [Clostridia bacterium]
MLLTVSPDTVGLKKIKSGFASRHFFSLYALPCELVSRALTEKPEVLLLLLCDLDKEMKERLRVVKEHLPCIKIISLCRKKSASPSRLITEEILFSRRLSYKTLLQRVLFHHTPFANASKEHGNLIVRGLYLDLRHKKTFVYGHSVSFTVSQIEILRLLAEAHPMHISAKDLARLCSFPGEEIEESSVLSRISRLNGKVKSAYALPRRLICLDEEGYYIAP